MKQRIGSATLLSHRQTWVILAVFALVIVIGSIQ